MDDAHDLLARAEPGIDRAAWTEACHRALPELSMPRRRELVRLLRDHFLSWTSDARLEDGLFVHCYHRASALGQIDLLAVAWAMSHPLSLVACDRLVAPALASGALDIPLDAVEDLVADHVDTTSAESRRKTRTVLLGALEGVGTLTTRGTGKHRSLAAARATPHPLAFGYLVLLDLQQRGASGMMLAEAHDGGLAARLTLCGPEHAKACVAWCVGLGLLVVAGDEVRAA